MSYDSKWAIHSLFLFPVFHPCSPKHPPLFSLPPSHTHHTPSPPHTHHSLPTHTHHSLPTHTHHSLPPSHTHHSPSPPHTHHSPSHPPPSSAIMEVVRRLSSKFSADPTDSCMCGALYREALNSSSMNSSSNCNGGSNVFILFTSFNFNTDSNKKFTPYISN